MNESKKKYLLTFINQFDVHVEVDHAVLTEEKAHEYLNFWMGAESRIAEYGTAFKAFLAMLCRAVMAESLYVSDVENAFNLGRVEGYPPLDGTHGIILISYDTFAFGYGETDVQEEVDDEIRLGH